MKDTLDTLRTLAVKDHVALGGLSAGQLELALAAVHATLPAARPMNGSRITALKIVIMKTPPVLCTHFPTDNPSVEVTTISDRITAEASVTNPLLAVIHEALGPMAYER